MQLCGGCGLLMAARQLDYYHTYEYDVIVLDLNLPDIDGSGCPASNQAGRLQNKNLDLVRQKCGG